MDSATTSPYSLSLLTFVSEDLAYYYGLFGVGEQTFTSFEFIFFYTIGVLLGDFILYGLGFLARYIPFLKKWVHKKRPVEQFGTFEEFLLMTRFIPGTRLPTYLYCGFHGYPLYKFLGILSFSTVFFALVGAGLQIIFNFNIGGEATLFQRLFQALIIALSAILTFKLIVKVYCLKKEYGEIKRPLLLSLFKYRNLEFWNSWFLYLPFVPHFLFFLVKFKGFGVCLNSNPSIFMGGFIGEKKSDIDTFMRQYIPEFLMDTSPFDQQSMEYKYPYVLKPDSGLRGLDVAIINNVNEKKNYLKNSNKKLIFQELCPHKNELGLFYIRFPGNDTGKIFSITKKKFPAIVGDGSSSLFELVLKNPELKFRFEWIFKNSKFIARQILPKGEKAILINRGSHSKGCVFKDGEELIPYCDLVVEVLNKLPGFYIGRADVRYESLEGLTKGEFKIIELNGAGAESTNIYDPTFSKRKVYNILYHQWKNVFEIGKANTDNQKNKGTIHFLLEILLYKFNWK